MEKSLNLTCQTLREEDQNWSTKYEQLQNEYQALKKEIQSIKSTYQNDQHLFRDRKSQLELATKTIESLKKKQSQLQKSEDQYKKKYQKLQITFHEEKNKEINILKDDHDKFKNEMDNKLKELNLLLLTKQENQREITQKFEQLLGDYNTLKLLFEQLNDQIADQNQREDMFQPTLAEQSVMVVPQQSATVVPQQSVMVLPQQSTIHPIKQRVLLKSTEADLINENKTLKFQIEDLKKRIKEKEQMSAKKENGLLMSIQKYESQRVKKHKDQKQPTEIAKLKAKKNQQSSVLQPKNYNIDQEDDTFITPSYLQVNQELFITLEKHYDNLPQKQKALFLNFLSCYAEQKFDRQDEISELYELNQ